MKMNPLNVMEDKTDNVYVKLTLQNSGRANPRYSQSGRRMLVVDTQFDGLINRTKTRLNKDRKANNQASLGYWDVVAGIFAPKGAANAIELHPQEIQKTGTAIARAIGYDNFVSQRDAEEAIQALANVCLSHEANTFLDLSKVSDDELTAFTEGQAQEASDTESEQAQENPEELLREVISVTEQGAEAVTA